MLNWLRVRKRNKAIRAARDEMATFTSNLARLDGPGRATVLVVATELRLNLEREDMIPEGLFDLESNRILDPTGKFLDKLQRLVRGFLKRDNPSDTAAAYVWLHTARALYYPELRRHGAALWSTLSPGSAHLLAALTEAEKSKGGSLDPRVAEQVRFLPQGLEITPHEDLS